MSSETPILDQAAAYGKVAADKATEAAKLAGAKANQVAESQTGKPLDQHAASLHESASAFAHHAADYAKGLVGLAGEKAAQAKDAADKTELPGNTTQTLGGLVGESRTLLGKVLESASQAIAVGEKKAVETVDETKKSDVSYIDQARNTIASGLKKAEDIVVGAGQAAGAKAEQVQAGEEPYTSNLMEGVKETEVLAQQKVADVTKTV